MPHDEQLATDQRGTVTVEYVIVLSLVTAGAAVATIGLGALLLALFRYQQALLLLPIP